MAVRTTVEWLHEHFTWLHQWNITQAIKHGHSETYEIVWKTASEVDKKWFPTYSLDFSDKLLSSTSHLATQINSSSSTWNHLLPQGWALGYGITVPPSFAAQIVLKLRTHSQAESVSPW